MGGRDRRDTLRPPGPAGTNEERVSIPVPRVPAASEPPRSVRVKKPSVPRLPRRDRPSSMPPPDPRREEGQAFLAEIVRAPLDALASAVPDPLPPDRQQRLDALVVQLAGSAPEADGPLRSRVVARGEEALPALARAFPGVLWVSLSRPHRPLRSARNLSPVARAFIDLGAPSAPFIATAMRSPRAETRLAACLVAGDLGVEELVRPLAARLHDDVRLVRDAAHVALLTFDDSAEAKRLRSELLLALDDPGAPLDWRRRAAWTLGQMRDVGAVRRLIEALGDDPIVADAAREALVRITGLDLGRFRRAWVKWWTDHASEPRKTWLADALDQKDGPLRFKAIDELILLTGEGYDRREEVSSRDGARALAALFR